LQKKINMKNVTFSVLQSLQTPSEYRQLIAKDSSQIGKARGIVAIKNFIFKNGKKETVLFFTKKSNEAKEAFKALKSPKDTAATKYPTSQLLVGQCKKGSGNYLEINVLDGGFSDEALVKEAKEVFAKLAVVPAFGCFVISEEEEETPAPVKTEEVKKEAPTTTTTSSGGISASVGRGGENKPEDVKIVQILLNQRGAKLSTDGQCGKITIATIEAIQRKMGMATPDGLIAPNGKTWQALSGAKITAPPTANTPPAATTAPATAYNFTTGPIEKGPVPAGFVRMKDKEVTKELSKAAVHYLNVFVKAYPKGTDRKPHYGEFIRYTTQDGKETLAHFEEHTVYGADLTKAQVPHPSIGLFKKKDA
jgi:hypothetical protein